MNSVRRTLFIARVGSAMGAGRPAINQHKPTSRYQRRGAIFHERGRTHQPHPPVSQEAVLPTRGARNQNESIGRVMEEAEQNLLSAFQKSQKNAHPGRKGDARAANLASFLEDRLPKCFGVACGGEAVDYLDQRSGELDVVIYDQIRNTVLSETPLWIAAESLLAYVEVKSVLSGQELLKSYQGAKKLSALRPFKRSFTLAGAGARDDAEDSGQLRCFRTLFAFQTDLTDDSWLDKEWNRIVDASKAAECAPGYIDRVLVFNRGLINPPSRTGTEKAEVASFFQQWFINLVNFLSRENARRPALDWQLYSKMTIPGWRRLDK